MMTAARTNPTVPASFSVKVTPHAPPVDLSIIVPAYNEEDSVEPLYRAVMAVPGLGLNLELIFVDDGSSDATFERLAGLAGRDGRVRVLKLRRNCGQTAAMVAGIDHARGRILVTMDADLQNDPADIPLLLDRISEGHDVVVGWRQDRQDRWLSRRLPSVVANHLIAKVTGVQVKDNGCTLKAFRAELIKALPLYADMHRFIPAMTSIAGSRLTEVPVRHHPRQFGRSNYGLSRIYKVIVDLLTLKILLVFARRPLASFVTTAAVTAAFSLLCLGGALYHAFGAVATSSVVFMGLSILLGSLAIFLGLAGVIVSLVCQHVLERSARAAVAGDLPEVERGVADE